MELQLKFHVHIQTLTCSTNPSVLHMVERQSTPWAFTFFAHPNLGENGWQKALSFIHKTWHSWDLGKHKDLDDKKDLNNLFSQPPPFWTTSFLDLRSSIFLPPMILDWAKKIASGEEICFSSNIINLKRLSLLPVPFFPHPVSLTFLLHCVFFSIADFFTFFFFKKIQPVASGSGLRRGETPPPPSLLLHSPDLSAITCISPSTPSPIVTSFSGTQPLPSPPVANDDSEVILDDFCDQNVSFMNDLDHVMAIAENEES